MPKIKYGLRNVHYAVITDIEKWTFGEVKKIPGAVTLSLSAEGDSSPFYADDIVYFNTTVNNGFTGDLEMALIPDEFKTDVLGWETDETTGALLEVANAISKEIALMFEFQNDDMGRRTILYRVSVGRPGIDHATKTETIEPQTETLTITSMPAEKGDKTYTRGIVKTADAGYATFFDAVQVPGGPVETEVGV